MTDSVPLRRAFTQLENGNLAAAKRALENITVSSASSGETKHLEARILEHEGKLTEAVSAYQAACNRADAPFLTFVDLADLLKRSGREAQARDVLRVAFKRFPKEPEIAAKLALTLLNGGHLSQARKLVEYALKVGSQTVESLEAAGQLYRASGQPQVAAELFKQAIELSSKFSGKRRQQKWAALMLNLAEAAKDQGEMALARTTLQDVLAQDKTNTRAWLILSSIISFDADALEIKKMINLLNGRKSKLSTSQKIDLGFALGKAFMDTGDAPLAMGNLNKANQLHRQRLPYQSEATCQRLTNYAQCYDKDYITNSRPPEAEDGPAPVFIVGMPRSGTTLIEQIIATHPEVFGADELTTLPRLKNQILGPDFPDAPDSKARLSSKDRLDQLAATYREESRQYLDSAPEDYRYLIDKQPGNFMFCGLITMAFSDAKIIHCKRNPIDTCLSCYSKYFFSGQSFTYDLTELGTYYRAYENLMKHWANILPTDRFIEVQYEDVIEHQERETRRLVEFLGIEWDPAMLAFHETQRTVKTASASQVRQPIYKSSVEKWRPYENELAPLIKALGIEIKH